MPAPTDGPSTDHDPQVAAAITILADRAALLQRAGGASLLDCFAAVPDPRSRRGVRHGLPTILGLCTAAVLSGCVTLTEITDWVTHADQDLLRVLGARQDTTTGRCVPPHPDTVERVVRALGAQGLAEHTGAYLGRQGGLGPVGAPVAGPTLLPALAIDGKAVKGAIGPDGHIPYLLAAATHQNSAVIAERLIGAKTNEVPEFAPLLRGLPVGGWVLSMDAAHTVRDTGWATNPATNAVNTSKVGAVKHDRNGSSTRESVAGRVRARSIGGTLFRYRRSCDQHRRCSTHHPLRDPHGTPGLMSRLRHDHVPAPSATVTPAPLATSATAGLRQDR